MKVLITGGAGYIGSHTAKVLKRAGHEPIVLDNLSRGHLWAVRWGPLIRIDLSELSEVRGVFHRDHFDAVIHLAAYAYVHESMQDPALYFRNNVVNTLNLLDAMRDSGTQTIVFSSSCAAYGEADGQQISEDHPSRPVSPYGESKAISERLLAWYERAYGIKWIALRYFNVAGADPDGEIGEVHEPETHLVPRALASAYGTLPALTIFGTDYATQDGTAVRDYVHVTDLAEAHVRALERLVTTGSSGIYNVGSGIGYSVREVVDMVSWVSGRPVSVEQCPRRLGDPASLISNIGRAAMELGWTPHLSALETVIRTAHQWFQCQTALKRIG